MNPRKDFQTASPTVIARPPVRITFVALLIGFLAGTTLSTAFFLWLNLDRSAKTLASLTSANQEKGSPDKTQNSGWLKAPNDQPYYYLHLTLNDSQWQRLDIPHDVGGKFSFTWTGLGALEWNTSSYKGSDPSYAYPAERHKSYKKYPRQYVYVRVFGKPQFRLLTFFCPGGGCQLSGAKEKVPRFEGGGIRHPRGFCLLDCLFTLDRGLGPPSGGFPLLVPYQWYCISYRCGNRSGTSVLNRNSLYCGTIYFTEPNSGCGLVCWIGGSQGPHSYGKGFSRPGNPGDSARFFQKPSRTCPHGHRFGEPREHHWDLDCCREDFDAFLLIPGMFEQNL